MRGLDLLKQIVEPAPAENPADALATLAKTFQDTDRVVAKRKTPGSEQVALDELQVDHDYQRPPDHEKIAEFRRTLRAGGSLPPFKVNRRPDGSLWITDGQHRAAALALEGHTHHDAYVTHKPSWEEQGETNLVAKVAPDRDGEVVSRLRGLGGVHKGKQLILDLGKHGQIAYAPHAETVGSGERGRIRVDSARADRVLERLGLSSLVGATSV